MTKKIIIIRHGKTGKDKQDPDRGVTKGGVAKLKNASKEVGKIVGKRRVGVIFTPTKRARMSAVIIAKECGGVLLPEVRNLRVENIVDLKKKDLSRPLTLYYFDLYKRRKLPRTIPSPVVVARRFIRQIKKFENEYEMLIFVGHGGALESFVNYQNKFIPGRRLVGELEYSEFVVLKRKEC